MLNSPLTSLGCENKERTHVLEPAESVTLVLLELHGITRKGDVLEGLGVAHPGDQIEASSFGHVRFCKRLAMDLWDLFFEVENKACWIELEEVDLTEFSG